MTHLKSILVVLLLTLIVVSCSNTSTQKPVYFDFKNDLEKDHLFGKIKSVTEYRANFAETGDDLTETPIISGVTEYTVFGKMAKKQTYSSFGILDKEENYEYNNKQLNTLSVLLMIATGDSVFQENEFDAKDNLIKTIIKHKNQMLISNMEYDKNKNIIKRISGGKDDTIKTMIKYNYNHNGKVEKEIQQVIRKNLTEQTITKRNYNSDNQLINIITRSINNTELKTVYAYDDGKLEKIQNFKNGQLVSETEYDKYFNAIRYKTYTNNTLDGEFEYTYEYDKNNNWISKTIEYKNSSEKESKLTKLFKLSRTIEYYQ